MGHFYNIMNPEVISVNEIGELIYERRKEFNLTLEQVGDAVGVGKSTVRKWENGMIKNIGSDKLAALAKVLRLDPVRLVPMPDVQLNLKMFCGNEKQLSKEEIELLDAWNNSSDWQKSAVRKLLNMEEG